VLNAVARVVSGTHKFDRGLSRLLHTELHWLNVPERVAFKARPHGVQLSAQPSRQCNGSVSDSQCKLVSLAEGRENGSSSPPSGDHVTPECKDSLKLVACYFKQHASPLRVGSTTSGSRDELVMQHSRPTRATNAEMTRGAATAM